MLTKVSLLNYRCFRSAEVRMSPLTVLVGPNAAGKSSFLGALRPSVGQLSAENRWQHRTDQNFLIEHSFTEGHAVLSRWTEQRGFVFAHSQVGLQLLHLDLAKLRERNQVARAFGLAEDGSNLVNLFASLGRRQQELVSEQFCKLVPAFRDVDYVPDETCLGTHRLRFHDRWNEQVSFHPNQVSDGTMLVLAYVLLQFEPQPTQLIAIEEPERGLHPYLLGELVSLWRKMTLGEIGPRPTQIVLATHSAELLDHLEPSEVRFFTRQDDGSIRVEEAPADDENWREAYKTYQDSLGGMWLSGGLGGVPGK